MDFRRVVTTHDGSGNSVLASDEVAPRLKKFVHTPGFAVALMWSTDAVPSVPHKDGDPTPSVTSWTPNAHGSRFLLVTFPPDAVMADPGFDVERAIAEHLAETPGIADKFEPDASGMHTTDTIDYGIVLEGEIWLELDNEQTIHLKPHDVIVQTGTRHAWRNKGNTPSTVAFVLLGARRVALS